MVYLDRGALWAAPIKPLVKQSPVALGRAISRAIVCGVGGLLPGIKSQSKKKVGDAYNISCRRKSPKTLSQKSSTPELFREETIDSYVSCLRTWHALQKFKFSFRKDVIHRHLESILQPFALNQLPKVFKGLLADYFSLMVKQERPDVLLSGKKLFPGGYQRSIHRALHNPTRRLRGCWDLMQCKSLAKEAHPSFVKESLLKHRNTVSQVCETRPDLLKEIEDFIQPWVDTVVESIPTTVSSIPNSHACLEKPRSAGGLFSALSSRIKESSVLQPSHPRLDPTTIVFCGAAGVGKSLLQAYVGKNLASRLEVPFSDAVYMRNADMKHWDGYNHQPLVQIDDFGQTNFSKTQVPQQILDFITLSSSVDFQLPMAKIQEKGRQFTSPLLLYSTNRTPGSFYGYLCDGGLDWGAVVRRVNYFLCWEQRKIVLYRPIYDGRKSCLLDSFRLVRVKTFDADCSLVTISESLSDLLMESWLKKSIFYSNSLGQAVQPITKGSKPWVIDWSSLSEPTNEVKVSAILEPLKVRTVTVGESRNWVLKPVQKAMLAALKQYPCFKPCFTPNYLEDIQGMKEISGVWLSGDYSAATDGLHSDIQRVILRSLYRRLKTSSVPDTLLQLLCKEIKREGGVHRVTYPHSYDIAPVDQTNGQLMGSLLSFPILCLINAFTICKATGKKLEQLPGLIHGDDVLARMSISQISEWKKVCPELGLELSIGKNYISPSWGSIDSQVFSLEGEKMVQLGTGKYGCLRLVPDGTLAQKTTTLLKRGVSKAYIVALGQRTKLWEKVPNSLDVDAIYGGLGLVGEPTDDLSKRVFSNRLEKRYRSRKVGQYHLYTVPEDWMTHSSESVVEFTEVEGPTAPDLWKDIRKQNSLYPLQDLSLGRKGVLCNKQDEKIEGKLRRLLTAPLTSAFTYVSVVPEAEWWD